MFKGFKVTIFNAILAITGIVKILAPDAELPGEAEASAIADNIESLWLIGIAAVNQVLRAFTTSAIFKKN